MLPKNRVDVVDLVVDLVDLDLDVDLVDVDLAVSLCDGPRSVLCSFGLVGPTCFICVWPYRRRFFLFFVVFVICHSSRKTRLFA